MRQRHPEDERDGGGVLSALTCGRVSAPYQIVAIGDPATLATAMEIPGGVADSTQRAGGAARTEQLDRVVIRALRAVRTPRYSQPTN